MTVTSSTPSSSLLGYNHIVRYNSRLYHVQTEDSGLDNPHITTHLFLNGMLMATLRCGYAGMLSVTDLESQVCKLMQEQHRAMIRQLRQGELDGLIRAQAGSLQPTADEEPTPPPGPEVYALDSLSDDEARAINRGKQISRVIAPLAAQPPGETPIPLDDLAFSGMPMLEWEGDGPTPELDLGAIEKLDLDASAGAGYEPELEALVPSWAQSFAAQASAVQAQAPAIPAVQAPTPGACPEASTPPRRRHECPSLPLPVVRVPIDESIFHPLKPIPRPVETDDPQQDFEPGNPKTLAFPAPFKDPDQVERESRAHETVERSTERDDESRKRG